LSKKDLIALFNGEVTSRKGLTLLKNVLQSNKIKAVNG